jgi:hypothetical protein
MDVQNIRVEPCTVVWGDTEFGFTDGDIEIAPEESGVDITAHQEGTNVLDMIRTGKNVQVTLTMKETTAAKLQEILLAGGETATPVAEVTSIGCIPDSGGSLNNKYFVIYTGSNGTGYYVWMNVNSAGVDPAPAGLTEVEITLATGATGTQVATAIKNAGGIHRHVVRPDRHRHQCGDRPGN